MSEVAVPDRVSGDVPSPQLTMIPVTVSVLETVNVTVTVSPVMAGFGVGLLTVTVGTPTGTVTVIDPIVWPVEPPLSVAVIVMVNEPPVVYA